MLDADKKKCAKWLTAAAAVAVIAGIYHYYKMNKCKLTTDCATGKICVNGWCKTPATCSAPSDCPSGMACTGGQCIPTSN